MRGGKPVVIFSINSDLLFPVSPFHTHLSTSTLTGFVPLYHCFPDWKIIKGKKCMKILAKGSWKSQQRENLKGQIYILKYIPGFLLKCNLYQINVCLFYYWLTMKMSNLPVDLFCSTKQKQDTRNNKDWGYLCCFSPTSSFYILDSFVLQPILLSTLYYVWCMLVFEQT